MNKGNWKFDLVSMEFEKHVRQHVPMYDEIHKLISNLSVWFVEDETNVYDIGTSLGEVINNSLVANAGRDAKYIGVDTSEGMVQRAQQRFMDLSNVAILHKSVEEVEFENASLITSVLTFPFIPLKKRQKIVNRIYEGLNDGGGFIFVEKVHSSSTPCNNILNDIYHDLKMENGVTKEEVVDKSTSIRGVLKTMTLKDNIRMLEDAGFSDIDTFFKWGNFVGLIAYK